jgi:mono/diheme cytochrome c family protein
MTRIWAALLLLTAISHGASAQPAGPALNDQQEQGRRLVIQHCSLCHVRANITSNELIGPALSRDSSGGRDDVLRGVISDGTPRMPGFKLQFEPTQIDAIIAYLKTVPPQPAAAAAPATPPR